MSRDMLLYSKRQLEERLARLTAEYIEKDLEPQYTFDDGARQWYRDELRRVKKELQRRLQISE